MHKFPSNFFVFFLKQRQNICVKNNAQKNGTRIHTRTKCIELFYCVPYNCRLLKQFDGIFAMEFFAFFLIFSFQTQNPNFSIHNCLLQFNQTQNDHKNMLKQTNGMNARHTIHLILMLWLLQHSLVVRASNRLCLKKKKFKKRSKKKKITGRTNG